MKLATFVRPHREPVMNPVSGIAVDPGAVRVVERRIVDAELRDLLCLRRVDRVFDADVVPVEREAQAGRELRAQHDARRPRRRRLLAEIAIAAERALREQRRLWRVRRQERRRVDAQALQQLGAIRFARARAVVELVDVAGVGDEVERRALRREQLRDVRRAHRLGVGAAHRHRSHRRVHRVQLPRAGLADGAVVGRAEGGAERQLLGEARVLEHRHVDLGEELP